MITVHGLHKRYGDFAAVDGISFEVAPGNGRMSPWEIDSQVQLIRANQTGMRGLGLTGYHLALGTGGDLTRVLTEQIRQELDGGKSQQQAEQKQVTSSSNSGELPGGVDRAAVEQRMKELRGE